MASSAFQPPFVLTLDLGSSSTRGALYDATATLVPGTLVKTLRRFDVGSDGRVVDDPAEALMQVTRCIDSVLAQAGSLAAQIGAVACGTYVANVLGVDDAGQPVTPIVTYADTRGSAVAVRLRTQLDEAAVWQRTGCPVRSSYWPALFTWLSEAQPQTMQRARYWMMLGQWLQHQFFGSAPVTLSAAAWTGLLDRYTLGWDAELLRHLPISAEQLGPLVDLDHATHGLREPWATRWPALRDIPWFGAVGDGAAANIGSGCVGPDRIALSVGTTGALRVVLADEPVIPQGLWCYRVGRAEPLLGGATSEGGNLVDWTRRTLQIELGALNQRLLGTPSDHGLTILPFITGERAPGWAGAVRATFAGIGATTSALDLAQAALEGVTYRWAQIAALLTPTLRTAPVIVASGGTLRHLPGWTQLVADALQLPVALSAEPEATSRGEALLALRALGVVEHLGQVAAATAQVVQPRLEHAAFHEAARERQQALYAQLHQT